MPDDLACYVFCHQGLQEGKKLAVRGYYKLNDDTKVIDKTDASTKMNLKTKEIKPGAKIPGRPFLKDGDVWVLETIENL